MMKFYILLTGLILLIVGVLLGAKSVFVILGSALMVTTLSMYNAFKKEQKNQD